MGREMDRSTAFPNLFIVGAAKAGTTSLYAHLRSHPEVWMSAWKEPHFFANVAPASQMRHLVRTFSELEYLQLFAGAEAFRVRGEASPSYLWDKDAAIRISERVPEARIIILLRDPVERAYSHYLMDVREGLQRHPFLQALLIDDKIEERRWGTRSHLYVDLGMYASQIRRYMDVFPREQILIVDFELLALERDRLFDELADFLKISQLGFTRVVPTTWRNSYARPRGRVAQTIMAQQWARSLARSWLPARPRQVLRNRLVASNEDKPKLGRDAVDWLTARLHTEMKDLERLLGYRLPSLRSWWEAENL